tara:strand:+ start:3 stop:1871 length:1869 start_codon:yes stop_codon:yes gene_type:complete
MKSSKILNNYIIIIFVTILLFSLKWILSYLNFPDEEIALRAMYEINDSSYFPLIKSFSNFDFNPSYNLEIDNLKLISFPVLSLWPNMIFFKIFGSYAFPIIEFIAIFLFLLIFYKIFCAMKIANLTSLFFSLILFTTPFFLNQLYFLDIDLIDKINLNFSTFYNLRNPRPLISNLYLFVYLYYLIKFFYLEERTLSTYIIISFIIGLSLHAFFYFFIFEVFLLLILYLIFFKYEIFNFIKLNYKSHIIFFCIILFFVFLFILQLYFSEYDYRKRMGVFYMDIEKKKIMIDYLFNFFSRIEFILLFVANTFLFLIYKKKICKIFYYFFISTIFSTIFFIFFSPSSMDYYHFFNWILTSGTLALYIGIFVIIEKKFISLISNKQQKLIIISSIFLILLNYNFFYNKNFAIAKQKNEKRDNLSKLVKFIKYDQVLSNKDSEILTLSYDAFLALLLNDYKNFYIVPSSFWTSKKTNIIENELISTFKLLNLSEDDFIKFFENIKTRYIYDNLNTQKFFDRLYLANKLKIYNDISNFKPEYISIINKTSVLYSHQTLIPDNEFLRLKKKFIKFNGNINSKIIILDNADLTINKHYLNSKDYCLRYLNKNFLIYVLTSHINKCELVEN